MRRLTAGLGPLIPMATVMLLGAIASAQSPPAPPPKSVGAIVSRPDPVSPAGVRATADLPVSRHIRNTGGSDGS